MEIINLDIKNYNDYVDYTNMYKNHKDIRLYRGQEENWNIESKLSRLIKSKNFGNDFYEIEQEIFINFKKELTKTNSTDSELDNWDILSIGRHYGLPTRLVDWTLNPLIALWFAFEKKKKNNNDRVVWGLIVDNLNLVDFEKDDPFNERFIKIFKPKIIDSRIIAQESWFSVQNPLKLLYKVDQEGDGLPHLNSYNNIINKNEDFDYLLVHMKISNNQRQSILLELDKLGINYNSIYPELEKICKNIEINIFKE